MSIVKWKTGGSRVLIARVECSRETESSVFFFAWNGERREAKKSSYHIYHDSWSSARDYLLEREKRNEQSARDKVERALRQIELLNSMAEPK